MARRWAWRAAGLLFLLGAVWRLNSAPAAFPGAVFEIPSGAPAGQVAARLSAEGAIRSRGWFLLLARLRGAAGRLKAGVYELKPGSSAWNVLDNFIGGRTLRAKVTVPEGFASWQIAERLEAAGVCPVGDFRVAAASASAEGFLFPDTYFFETNTPAPLVVDMMRARFETAWAETVSRAARERPEFTVADSSAPGAAGFRFPDRKRPWTRNEVVTLASIIEREAGTAEERPLISAVFHNRLRRGMRLESDPTVQFTLGYWKDRILYRDLDAPGPYNTYRRFGLPPGPICSPGRASLLAALVPAESDALYFVANERGGHDFFVRYQDHLKGVRERRKIQRLKKERLK